MYNQELKNNRRTWIGVVASLGLIVGLWAGQGVAGEQASKKGEDGPERSAEVDSSHQANAAPETALEVADDDAPVDQPPGTEGSPGTGGLRVYRDPATGELSAPPTAPSTGPFRISQETARSLSSSHDGLVEVPLPNGGVLLDLGGRFRSASYATVDDQGQLRIDFRPPAETRSTAGENNDRY